MGDGFVRGHALGVAVTVVDRELEGGAGLSESIDTLLHVLIERRDRLDVAIHALEEAQSLVESVDEPSAIERRSAKAQPASPAKPKKAKNAPTASDVNGACELAKEIRRLRQKLGISQTVAARWVERNGSGLGNFENGKGCFAASRAEKILELLKKEEAKQHAPPPRTGIGRHNNPMRKRAPRKQRDPPKRNPGSVLLWDCTPLNARIQEATCQRNKAQAEKHREKPVNMLEDCLGCPGVRELAALNGAQPMKMEVA